MARESRFDFLDDRPLEREDMSSAERRRMDQKRKEQQRGAPAIAVTETNDPRTKDALLGLRPRSESRRRVVDRISHSLINPDPNLRMPGESTVPGADWYPAEHASVLRATAVQYGTVPEHTATSSGAMSPQNDPAFERVAAAAIAHAESRGAQFRITAPLKDAVEQSMPVDKKTGERKPTPVSGLAEGTHRFSDLPPEAIRDMTSAGVRETGLHDTDVDLAGIAKAGTNKVNGVRGARGVPLNELAPPSSAPKVNTYARHGYTFGVPFAEDAATEPTPESVAQGKQWSPFIAEEIRFRATHAATQIPGQTTIDTNGTKDDTIQMTKGLHDYLTSRGAPVRGSQIGQSVRVRDLHPAAVLAMSHPAVEEHHPDGEHLRKLALLSSNLPPVIDSHANGTVHGYPGITAKPTGSGRAGYWPRKTLDDGTSIVDSKDARVTTAGLQHAEYGSIMRDAAHDVVRKMGMDLDYPSTAAQAGTWTEGRRLGEDDPKFAAYQRSRKNPEPEPTDGGFAQAVRDRARASVPDPVQQSLDGMPKPVKPS